MTRYAWGIDPGYSERNPTTGWIVLELGDDGTVCRVVERGHVTASRLSRELPRLWETFTPVVVGVDAPLMDVEHGSTPYVGASCRPQEQVSMSRHFSDRRLKAGHAFTPRGLELHRAGMRVLETLRELGAGFQLWDRVGERLREARSGGAPLVVESFPKIWLGLQHPTELLEHLTRDSHDRDHAMMRELLRRSDLVAAHRLGCAVELRLVTNADELAAATSALSALSLLYGCEVSARPEDRRGVLLGSAEGGHFALPPRAIWHRDHRAALEEAVASVRRRHPASCGLLSVECAA